ncbi:MAG: penicillin-binding protein 2 [bacterium]|nr:penicillin-binding protein 2 [bacterium]
MSAFGRKRVVFLGAMLAFAALFIVGRLYVVAVVHGDEYAEKSIRQYSPTHADLFDRGTIFFTSRTGDKMSAATLTSGYTLAIDPTHVADGEVLYTALNSHTEIDHSEFTLKVGRSKDPYEEISKRLEKKTADAIEAEALPGVIIAKDRWRFYPGGTLGAHILGFLGFSGDEYAGRYGLERYYEDTLVREGSQSFQNFFAELFSGVRAITDRGRGAGDLVLTIEPRVELELERELESIFTRWKPSRAGGIVMNPTTGEVYAMAVSPTFDPNQFQDVKDQSVFVNSAVEHVYEMGSIMKPLTMAAGIDSGVVSRTTRYEDKGFLIVDGARISNFDGKARGNVTMQEVLNQSLNTGAAYIAKKVGKEKFRNYFLDLGFGEETGIDLPNEVQGLVKNLDSPRDIEFATASFGQGIATTPIAMARALSALASGGRLPSPHVVSRIETELGVPRNITYESGRQVFKPETTEEITKMLVEVVDKALLGGTAKLPRYSVAAKTGTAQIPKEREKGYYDDRVLHSFFGYFPAYKPQFLVFLWSVAPNAAFASETLTKPFFDITKFLINYYEIPPDR